MKESITCTKCGWVHFAVTRAYAEAQVEYFNAYLDTISPEDHQRFWGGRRPTIADYEGCKLCANTSFRPFEPGDCPDGSTTNPVIFE